jgi:hypothetical protein
LGVVVTFDYSAWKARYPEFATVPQATVEDYFVQATLYHADDGSGPVCNASQQLSLLGLLTAHIAQLNYLASSQPVATGSPQLVGGIQSASEGTVSVNTKLDVPQAAQWFAQTKYGLSYWQATAGFRTMRYSVPAPRTPWPFWSRRF